MSDFHFVTSTEWYFSSVIRRDIVRTVSSQLDSSGCDRKWELLYPRAPQSMKHRIDLFPQLLLTHTSNHPRIRPRRYTCAAAFQRGCCITTPPADRPTAEEKHVNLEATSVKTSLFSQSPKHHFVLYLCKLFPGNLENVPKFLTGIKGAV